MGEAIISFNRKKKGLKALDKQMLSYVVPPIMFPVHGLSFYRAPRVRYVETLKGPLPKVKKKAEVLPRELPRLRASVLTSGKKYGSVMDVLQIIYGQDFGTILKDYVENHQVELHEQGVMRDSLYIRFGGIGQTYIETNYDQSSRDFFLDVVVDTLLEGERYPQCVTLYIR